jgi:hypothetical protein
VTSKQLAKLPAKHPDREGVADGADGCGRLQADTTTTTKIISRGFIGFVLTDISDLAARISPGS